MDNQPNVVIITSDQLRHRYFCKQLSINLNITGIIAESKSTTTIDYPLFNIQDQKLVEKHFKERDEVEKQMLGREIDFPEADILTMNFGEVNNDVTFDWIRGHNPDLILLYGSSIIKEPILSFYKNKIINLHLGLSPYYKGSATNFWPFVYNQPECVGGTIHLAVEKVDAGSILHQFRPEFEENDKMHEIGTKTIIKATNLIPLVVDKYLSNETYPVAQNQKTGRIFRNKDFNADALKKAWHNFDNGMIHELLLHRKERYNRFPIIEINLQLQH